MNSIRKHEHTTMAKTFIASKSWLRRLAGPLAFNYKTEKTQKTSITFLTKKKLTRENTNEDSQGGDEIFEETWENIEIDHLIKLSDIKDIDELDMYKY